MNCVSIQTPEGAFLARFTDAGLAGLKFPFERAGRGQLPAVRLTPRLRSWVAATKQAIEAVLKGQCPRRLPPLDVSAGTAFQQRVWLALCAIPAGQTRTYGQVAAAVGRPGAARAVGQACGANPIPLLVPCHRVLAAGGRLGGFSAGLKWKRKLLASERPGD
jgi:O-6-methylguanine DNA methyltransferase